MIIYFSDQVGQVLGEYEKRKIDTWAELDDLFTEEQVESNGTEIWDQMPFLFFADQRDQMNRTGFSMLDQAQLEHIYGPSSPFNDSKALARLRPLLPGNGSTAASNINEVRIHHVDHNNADHSLPAHRERHSSNGRVALLWDQAKRCCCKQFSLIFRRKAKLKKQNVVQLSPSLFRPTVDNSRWSSKSLIKHYSFTSPFSMKSAASQPFILSPVVFSPTIRSPTILGPAILSPSVFSPIVRYLFIKT